jgi:hypothetical protein
MPLAFRRIHVALLALAALLLALVAGPAAPGGGEAPAAAASTATITNPYVAFASVRRAAYTGRERDEEGKLVRTRTEWRLLTRTKVVDGIRSAVVTVKDFEDGKLVEQTFDYYAQRKDGSVLYMGEDVNDLEDGKVVGHGGAWLAGRRGARPGLFMPAKPRRGQRFQQERAPGVAEDRSTVIGTERTVTTPAGRFEHCIKTRDYAPLDKITEHKYYCRGVGLVREDLKRGRSLLVSYGR